MNCHVTVHAMHHGLSSSSHQLPYKDPDIVFVVGIVAANLALTECH